jgi:hypothetical protein
MSYVVHIWQAPVPTNESQAWEIIEQLEAEQGRCTTPGLPTIVEFLKRITSRYPDLMDIPDEQVDDLGVWTDGPMIASGPIEIVGIVRDRVDEVQPFVISVANELGLVCYDMQINKLYLPHGIAYHADAVDPPK